MHNDIDYPENINNFRFNLHAFRRDEAYPVEWTSATWVGVGMRYYAVTPVGLKIREFANKQKMSDLFQSNFDLMDARRNLWEKKALKCPTLYEYLKEKYYDGQP